jgi:acyl carrier protein
LFIKINTWIIDKYYNFVQNFDLSCQQLQKELRKLSWEKLFTEESEVVPEASFTNDLGADSLDTVELIMEFEREFDINIPDEQAETITTVGEAIAYLEENVKS